MGVYGDAIGIAQDGVVHYIDPGMNGRNGPLVANDIVEISTNVPHLVHDVHRSVGNFVSDRQAINTASAVFLYGTDEYADIFVDLDGTRETLSFLTFEDRDLIGGLGLTREAELAIVPSDFQRQQTKL